MDAILRHALGGLRWLLVGAELDADRGTVVREVEQQQQ